MRQLIVFFLQLALMANVAWAAEKMGMRVGDPFPSIFLPALEDGSPVSLADFQGQKLMLHIWASW